MNVMKAITGIQFIGKGKIMQQCLIRGNLREHYEDLSARRKREDSDLARYYLVAIK